MNLNNIPHGGTLGGKIMVKHVQENEFSAEVLNFDGVSVVDFWASWCGPCKMLLPVVEKFAEEVEGKVKVAKVNVDEEPSLAQRYGIMTIPTLLVFKNGELTAKSVGVISRDEIVKLIG